MDEKDIREMGLGELVGKFVVSYLACEKLTQTSQRADGTFMTDHLFGFKEEEDKIALYQAELDHREKLYLPAE